ncbi:MAG: hypothetical protein RBQ88_12040 [Desulfobulbus oligotrophicus]|nr:hypothetical protein [Desulfobulbus oligotrophicus]
MAVPAVWITAVIGDAPGGRIPAGGTSGCRQVLRTGPECMTGRPVCTWSTVYIYYTPIINS